MLTFTYDAEKCADGSLNEMRFSLGDCLADDWYLSDEEIKAQLAAQRSFKMAKYKLLESLLFRFGYDAKKVKIHESVFDYSGRLDFWKKMYDDLTEEMKSEEEAQGMSYGFSSRTSRAAAFTIGMHDVQ